MKKSKNYFRLDQPLTHADHRRPMSRREFISQGFNLGTGLALTGSLYGLLGNTKAHALSQDLQDFLRDFNCGAFDAENEKVPFICFDLAGGANVAGSNVLVGGPGGQQDFLSTSGYLKQGLLANEIPNASQGNNIDTTLGLEFHSQSEVLRGILDKATAAAPNINGAVVPARSENDTGNNPHNPMYAINRYMTSTFAGDAPTGNRGASGSLLSLVGSRSSDSGGNSMAPAMYIEPEYWPTKIDRPSDATGLVDTGELINLLGQVDTEVVMESIYRLSNAKLGQVNTQVTTDDMIKDLVRCGYLKGAANAEQSPDDVDPTVDPRIFGGIFDAADATSNSRQAREFRKTASVMRLVLGKGDGGPSYAGAGTITMGGYDYHTGDRVTGDERDFLAGQCIGACLEYARLIGRKVMIYVFSDGSVFSNGMLDPANGRAVWTGDNQQTAASFFLVYDPNGQPSMVRQQVGHMRPSGDVETGVSSSASIIANNVNLLVDAVTLNYMALHDDLAKFPNLFPESPLGSASIMDSLTAFNPIT